MKLTTDKVVWDSYYEMKEKLDETQANLDETRWKLILMETKLEDLECNNNNKLKKPRCPICFEEMSSNTNIAQCHNGHLLCWSCKEKISNKNCPSCGLPVDGRAFGM